MKRYFLLIPVILVLTLSSCNQKSEGNKTFADDHVEKSLAPPPKPPEGVTTLSDYGLGPIKKDTRFNEDSISALLDGFTIVSATADLERGKFRIFEGRKGEQKVFEFYPDSKGEKVGSIKLFTDEFEGPDGIRVGMTYRAAKGETMNCFPGMASQRGKVLCFKGGNTRVQYIFSHESTGPDDQLPAPDVLAASGKVEQIIWYAKRK